MTLSELRTLYKHLVGIDVLREQNTTQFQATIAGSGGDPDVVFNPDTFINWAYEDWCSDSMIMTDERDYTIAAGQRRVVMDEDFLWLMYMRILEGSEYVRLFPVTSSEMNTVSRQWHITTGTPKRVVVDVYRWGIFVLYPIPVADVSIRASIVIAPYRTDRPGTYPSLIRPLTAADDIPRIPYEAHMSLAYKAAYYALRATGSPAQSKLSLEYYKTYIESVAKNRQWHERAGANYPWRMREGI